MSILDTPVATYSRSDLRKPEVIDAAQTGPVEIRHPNGDLVLVRQTEVDRVRQVQAAVENFLRVLVEVRRTDPSPIVLGEVSFVADWPTEDRERFLEGYAEAIDAAVRTNDLSPVDLFIKTMGAPTPVKRADFDGRVAPDARDRISTRLSS